jgi:hypothetical protein
MRNVLAVAAALLVILSGIPYLVDIVRRKTKPNVVSWFTWTLLTAVAGAAALGAHEPRTAILTFGNAISTLLIVLLGLKYGFAKLSIFDGVCQLGAVVGLVLWLIFNSPEIAIVATVSIDLIATLPTLRHSWLNPQEETWQTFSISALGATLGLVAISHYSVSSLAYPVYLLLMDSAVAIAIIISRKRKGLALAR